jgi:hypothetical protein
MTGLNNVPGMEGNVTFLQQLANLLDGHIAAVKMSLPVDVMHYQPLENFVLLPGHLVDVCMEDLADSPVQEQGDDVNAWLQEQVNEEEDSVDKEHKEGWQMHEIQEAAEPVGGMDVYDWSKEAEEDCWQLLGQVWEPADAALPTELFKQEHVEPAPDL